MRNNLVELSDSELIGQLENLVAHEKETTTEIIRHLSEVEVRRLYLELGYSSLFDYATRKLGYSEASAVRRIKVARAVVKVPEICNYLTEEKVSLSAITACAGVLIKENGKQVLEQLRGKTKEEAEWISASFNPVTSNSVKDKIKKIVIGATPTPQTDLFTPSEQFPTKSFCNHSEGKFKISFTANAEFMEKLTRAQELMFSGSAQDLLLENIFGETLDLYLEKHCPKEKQKRRDAKAARKETVVEANEPTSPIDNDQVAISEVTTPSRYIPAAVRDKVLERDNYQCSYTSPQGTKCSCRYDLEIDHILPFAMGGKSEVTNLRVLCASHNLHAARRVLGAEFMERKIGRRLELQRARESQ